MKITEIRKILCHIRLIPEISIHQPLYISNTILTCKKWRGFELFFKTGIITSIIHHFYNKCNKNQTLKTILLL